MTQIELLGTLDRHIAAKYPKLSQNARDNLRHVLLTGLWEFMRKKTHIPKTKQREIVLELALYTVEYGILRKTPTGYEINNPGNFDREAFARNGRKKKQSATPLSQPRNLAAMKILDVLSYIPREDTYTKYRDMRDLPKPKHQIEREYTWEDLPE